MESCPRASIFEFGDLFLHLAHEFLAAQALAEADKHRVVPTGNGSKDVVKGQVVHRQGDGVRMTGIGLDDDHTVGPIDGYVSAKEILYESTLGFLPVVIAWQRIDIPVMAVGNLAYFKEFEIPRQGRLGNDETFLQQMSKQRFLGFYSICFYQFPYGFKACQSFFHRYSTNIYVSSVHKHTMKVSFMQVPASA